MPRSGASSRHALRSSSPRTQLGTGAGHYRRPRCPTSRGRRVASATPHKSAPTRAASPVSPSMARSAITRARPVPLPSPGINALRSAARTRTVRVGVDAAPARFEWGTPCCATGPPRSSAQAVRCPSHAPSQRASPASNAPAPRSVCSRIWFVAMARPRSASSWGKAVRRLVDRMPIAQGAAAHGNLISRRAGQPSAVRAARAPAAQSPEIERLADRACDATPPGPACSMGRNDSTKARCCSQPMRRRPTCLGYWSRSTG